LLVSYVVDYTVCGYGCTRWLHTVGLRWLRLVGYVYARFILRCTTYTLRLPLLLRLLVVVTGCYVVVTLLLLVAGYGWFTFYGYVYVVVTRLHPLLRLLRYTRLRLLVGSVPVHICTLLRLLVVTFTLPRVGSRLRFAVVCTFVTFGLRYIWLGYVGWFVYVYSSFGSGCLPFGWFTLVVTVATVGLRVCGYVTLGLRLRLHTRLVGLRLQLRLFGYVWLLHGYTTFTRFTFGYVDTFTLRFGCLRFVHTFYTFVCVALLLRLLLVGYTFGWLRLRFTFTFGLRSGWLLRCRLVGWLRLRYGWFTFTVTRLHVPHVYVCGWLRFTVGGCLRYVGCSFTVYGCYTVWLVTVGLYTVYGCWLLRYVYVLVYVLFCSLRYTFTFGYVAYVTLVTFTFRLHFGYVWLRCVWLLLLFTLVVVTFTVVGYVVVVTLVTFYVCC